MTKKLFKILVGFTVTLLVLSVFGTGLMYSTMHGMGMGLSDFSRNVGNDYQLSRSSSNDVQIVPKDGWGSGDAIIPSKVIALNIYKDWVFAKRQELKTDPTNPSMQIPDDSVYDFQALNTKQNKVYVFKKQEELRNFLDQQGIPKDLNLIDVHEFKNKHLFYID